MSFEETHLIFKQIPHARNPIGGIFVHSWPEVMYLYTYELMKHADGYCGVRVDSNYIDIVVDNGIARYRYRPVVDNSSVMRAEKFYAIDTYTDRRICS